MSKGEGMRELPFYCRLYSATYWIIREVYGRCVRVVGLSLVETGWAGEVDLVLATLAVCG